jgi:flagellar motor switch protein FliN/FliY
VDPVIAEQPYEPLSPDRGMAVDADFAPGAQFAPDPAGAPLEAFPAAVPAGAAPAGDADLARLHAVPVELAVEIGRTRMTIGDTLGLGPGSIITLNRMAGEPVDLLVNGRPIARGEVVVIDEEFGLRVTEVVGSAVGGNAA